MIRKWDITDEQAKRRCIGEVLTRIGEQDDAPFGIIAAQDIIDIVAAHVGPSVRNATLEETKALVQTKLIDLEVDIDVLKVKG